MSGAAVEFEARLYSASAQELLERVREVPDDVESVLLIGHNPGLERLVLDLAAPGPERERDGVTLPTGALATLAFDARWCDLAPRTAELVGFVVPRELR